MSSMGSVAAATYSGTTATAIKRFQAKVPNLAPAEPGIALGATLSHSELRAIRPVFLRLRVEYPFGENQL
jgi:hypothetical protein